jgi:hypothetical protein
MALWKCSSTLSKSLHWLEVSFTIRPLYTESAIFTHWVGGWMDPRGCFCAMEMKKIPADAANLKPIFRLASP